MKKIVTTILLMMLALGFEISYSQERIELHEFEVSCFNDKGEWYPVYYIAPEPVSYDEEVKMCELPSIHGKFIN